MFVFLLWIKEAFLGLFRNFWWNSIAFLMSLVCLLVFSLSFIAGDTAQYLTTKFNQKLEIKVDIKDKYTDYESMKNQLRGDDRIRKVSFVSKSEAEKIMKKEMGKGANVLDIYKGENIFPAQFIVKVRNVNDIENVANSIKKLEFVEDALYGKQFIGLMLNVTEKIKKIGYYISIGGIVIVVFLVMWIIRMNIEQRKQEIDIKQLIGSSFFTIRVPFVFEALFLMAVASGSCFFIVSYGYQKIYEYIQRGMVSHDFALLPLSHVQSKLMIPLFGLAVVIGFFGSVIATNRHLKKV